MRVNAVEVADRFLGIIRRGGYIEWISVGCRIQTHKSCAAAHFSCPESAACVSPALFCT